MKTFGKELILFLPETALHPKAKKAQVTGMSEKKDFYKIYCFKEEFSPRIYVESLNILKRNILQKRKNCTNYWQSLLVIS